MFLEAVFVCRRGGLWPVKIIKRINTNAVLALDNAGSEVVALGKGLGFPKVPYELEDLTKVDRTFYDIDPKYFNIAEDISRSVILASADICEIAEMELTSGLNPNVPFTLADHLSFSIERFKKNLEIKTPLAYDVKHLYPKEYDIGVRALDILSHYTGVKLPQTNAVGVALHLINAEVETGNIHSTMQILGIIEDVDNILEDVLDIALDKDDFYYSRFTMHLRYLIQRLIDGKQTSTKLGLMLRQMAVECPLAYHCARKVSEYLLDRYGWRCNDEEILYLLMHINRVKEQFEDRQHPAGNKDDQK